MDRDLRDLERRASSGDPSSLAALLRVQIRVGHIEVNRVRLAASLGHPIAQQLDLPPYTSPAGISRAWFRLNKFPYLKRTVHIINAISCEINDHLSIELDIVFQELSSSLHMWANNLIRPATASNRGLAIHFCRIDPEYSGFYLDLTAMALYHGVRELGHVVGDECWARIIETGMSINTFETLINQLAHTSIFQMGGAEAYYKNRYVIMLLNHAVLPEYPLPIPPIGALQRCSACGRRHMTFEAAYQQVGDNVPRCEHCSTPEGFRDPCLGEVITLHDGICQECHQQQWHEA